MKRGSNILPILFCVFSLTVLAFCIAQEMSPPAYADADDSPVVSVLSSVLSFPGHIVANAAQNGGIEAAMFGSSAEKHAFAKGRHTRFGQMTMDADEELQKRGWSEVQIHDLGHRYGFSNLWGQRH